MFDTINLQAEIRRFEILKMLYLMGSGRVGSDGNQKCPSMFFLLYEYLDNVYVNLNIYKKIVTNILMGFKM